MMMMYRGNYHHCGECKLLFAAILFGLQYVFQKLAMDIGVHPLTFNALRTIGATLIIFILRNCVRLTSTSSLKENDSEESEEESKLLDDVEANILHIYPEVLLNSVPINDMESYRWGILIGLMNSIPGILQQVGIVYVDATIAAFTISLYIIVTPFLEFYIFRINYSFSWTVWLAAGVSILGMFFLSDLGSWDGRGDYAVFGEILLLLSMVFYSLEIIYCAMATRRVECVKLCCIQFVVSSIISILVAIYFERKEWIAWPIFSSVNSIVGWGTVFITSLTEAFGLMLGLFGQIDIPPSRAAIIYSLDVVFTAIFAHLFLSEILSWNAFFGCCLMFVATILSSSGIQQTQNNT